MQNEKPTGETRLRLHKPMFGAPLLVLQIKVVYPDGPDDYHGMPEWLAGEAWRDAKITDMTFLGGLCVTP